MQLFRSPGIGDPPHAGRPRSYRWLWFGPRRAASLPSQARGDADGTACVRALTQVPPVRWEDVLASYDRAA